MPVGIHLKLADVNNLAAQLLRTFQSLKEQNDYLKTVVAPYNAAELAAALGNDPTFSTQDATNLISAITILDDLFQVAAVNGTPDPGLCATASQTVVALNKFGGV